MANGVDFHDITTSSTVIDSQKKGKFGVIGWNRYLDPKKVIAKVRELYIVTLSEDFCFG